MAKYAIIDDIRIKTVAEFISPTVESVDHKIFKIHCTIKHKNIELRLLFVLSKTYVRYYLFFKPNTLFREIFDCTHDQEQKRFEYFYFDMLWNLCKNNKIEREVRIQAEYALHKALPTFYQHFYTEYGI